MQLDHPEMTDAYSLLTIQDYVRQARLTDKKSDSGSIEFPLLGLFGETGSLLSEVKKKQRDSASYVGYASAVVEEFGDVLWYLTIVVDRRGLSLVDVALPLIKDGASNDSIGDKPITFAMLQPEIMPLTKTTWERMSKCSPNLSRRFLHKQGIH